MTVLSAQAIWLRQPILNMQPRTVHKPSGMTFGVSGCGYDVRVAERIILPPNHMTLASTMEEFMMPDYLVGIVHDKSTWARQGLCVQNTVIEPGWRGFLTLELTNHGPLNIETVPGTPIAQVLFHMLDQPTNQPYSGKYQDQPAGPQEARFDK